MARITTLFVMVFLSAIAFAQTPQWVRSAGSAEDDQPYAVALDAAGNAYVCGYFQGSFTIGGLVLVSQGNYDVFIARLNSDGSVGWAVRAGGTGWDYATDIAVDDADNLYISGHCEGGEPLFGTLSFVTTGTIDGYVAKMSSTGAFEWVSHTEGTPGTNVTATGVDVDDAGNVVICGATNVGFSIQGTAFTDYVGIDMYLAYFDNSGVLQWGHMFNGNNGREDAEAVAFDSQGRILLGGEVDGDVDLGGITSTPFGSFSPFVAQFENDGSPNWVTSWGSTWFTGDELKDLEVDGEDNAVAAGYMFANGSIDGSVLTTAALFEGYVVKIDPAGDVPWSQYLASTTGTGSQTWGVGIGDNNEVYVAGYFDGTSAVIDGVNHTGLGSHDVVVRRYDAGGNSLGHAVAGGSSSNDGIDVAIDDGGSAFVFGRYLLTCTFGTTSITSAGSNDVFLAKYAAHAIGMEEIVAAPSLNAHPIPIEALGTLYFDRPQDASRAEIIDAQGRVVQASPLRATMKEQQLTIGDLDPGCYILRIMSDRATVATTELIVR